MVSLRVPPAPLPSLGAVLDLILPCPAIVAPLVEPADVIVPIHNGAGHLKRLFGSLFNHTDPRHRILLADDGSTDPEVAQLLAWAAANRPNVRVLSSVGNRGFIETVNAAMQVTSGHVAILNTDTEVPAGWLERLLQPIATRARIASTTPFSNAASIYGFPIADLDQELPAALGVAEIDAAFARLSPDDQPPLTAPTAIGFCMGINRTAWQSCGAFDAATFGRGYCEETDWCLRAAAAGWRSVLVPNLFVYHAHGGTFARPERKALLEANIAALHLRWPDYYRRLTLFRRQRPLGQPPSGGAPGAGNVRRGPAAGDRGSQRRGRESRPSSGRRPGRGAVRPSYRAGPDPSTDRTSILAARAGRQVSARAGAGAATGAAKRCRRALISTGWRMDFIAWPGYRLGDCSSGAAAGPATAACLCLELERDRDGPSAKQGARSLCRPRRRAESGGGAVAVLARPTGDGCPLAPDASTHAAGTRPAPRAIVSAGARDRPVRSAMVCRPLSGCTCGRRRPVAPFSRERRRTWFPPLAALARTSMPTGVRRWPSDTARPADRCGATCAPNAGRAPTLSWAQPGRPVS